MTTEFAICNRNCDAHLVRVLERHGDTIAVSDERCARVHICGSMDLRPLSADEQHRLDNGSPIALVPETCYRAALARADAERIARRLATA